MFYCNISQACHKTKITAKNLSFGSVLSRSTLLLVLSVCWAKFAGGSEENTQDHVQMQRIVLNDLVNINILSILLFSWCRFQSRLCGQAFVLLSFEGSLLSVRQILLQPDQPTAASMDSHHVVTFTGAPKCPAVKAHKCVSKCKTCIWCHWSLDAWRSEICCFLNISYWRIIENLHWLG